MTMGCNEALSLQIASLSHLQAPAQGPESLSAQAPVPHMPPAVEPALPRSADLFRDGTNRPPHLDGLDPKESMWWIAQCALFSTTTPSASGITTLPKSLSPPPCSTTARLTVRRDWRGSPNCRNHVEYASAEAVYFSSIMARAAFIARSRSPQWLMRPWQKASQLVRTGWWAFPCRRKVWTSSQRHKDSCGRISGGTLDVGQTSQDIVETNWSWYTLIWC